jgi:DNA-binding transcriptional LysR family regulator
MHMENDFSVELPALRCFDVLMRERSVTRAAERLGLSQPAVSHALARLRRRFADPLLVRDAQGMTPTPRALGLHEAVRDVLAAMERLEQPVRSFDPSRERSRFVVTVTDYFERLLAPLLLDRLQREAPGVCIDWQSPRPASARARLENGEVDLRLGWVHAPWPGLRYSSLFADRLVCLVRADHPRIGRRLRLADFFELAHVRPGIAVSSEPSSDDTSSVTLEQYLGLAASPRRGATAPASTRGWEAYRHRTLRIAMLAQNFLTIPSVVAHTDLIATVPALLTRDAGIPPSVRVLQPPLDLPTLLGALYWHERTNTEPRHRWLRAVIAEVAAGIGS